MTLDEYLKQFIEGYLLEDLKAMGTIRPDTATTFGGVYYPMVMTTLAGIEVLGALTSSKTFNAGNGAARFGEFWRTYLYPHKPAWQRLDALVYDFIRHGLAHAFMTKPVIVVTKAHDDRHLTTRPGDDALFLDALTLANDFLAAYTLRLTPLLAGPLRITMETRFLEFRAANWQERTRKLHLLQKAPAHSLTERPITADSINSPSLETSTRAIRTHTTTGFDDPDA